MDRQTLESHSYCAGVPGRALLLAALIALLPACATQLEAPGLRFQSSSVEIEGVALTPDELRPGDIVLSAAPTLSSVGIQVLTFAPVSHAALYIGEGKVVEALPPRVQVRSVEELLAEEDMALVLRHRGLSDEQAEALRDYALGKTGSAFSYFGVTLQGPFSVARRVCELPLVPSALRDLCLRGLGSIQYLAPSERQFFCSQLVLQAYEHAGTPLTGADPRMMAPSDILHMREGDVPSVRVHTRLHYVGHLKYRSFTVAAR